MKLNLQIREWTGMQWYNCVLTLTFWTTTCFTICLVARQVQTGPDKPPDRSWNKLSSHRSVSPHNHIYNINKPEFGCGRFIITDSLWQFDYDSCINRTSLLSRQICTWSQVLLQRLYGGHQYELPGVADGSDVVPTCRLWERTGPDEQSAETHHCRLLLRQATRDHQKASSWRPWVHIIIDLMSCLVVVIWAKFCSYRLHLMTAISRTKIYQT